MDGQPFAGKLEHEEEPSGTVEVKLQERDLQNKASKKQLMYNSLAPTTAEPAMKHQSEGRASTDLLQWRPVDQPRSTQGDSFEKLA